ncbi:hypothetical protein GGR56DRAFT_34891 [Xylariaceae sp. FL0804]|nr:hypothetical protein GGR56DRAFT_34891 [Xylariaceae sp. FL0804]
MKGFVMLTDPSKPLPRASKDTVQRHALFKLYGKEWKALYERLARTDHSSEVPAMQPSSSSPETPGRASGEADGDIILSGKISSAIESLVERQVSAALDRFAFALMAAASQLDSTGLSLPVPDAQDLKPSAVGAASTGGLTNSVGHSREARTCAVQADYPATGPSTLASQPDEQKRLRQLIHDMLAESVEVDNLDDDTDLFKSGLDSLLVVSLVKAINASITKAEKPHDPIKVRTVYENPTVVKLVLGRSSVERVGQDR